MLSLLLLLLLLLPTIVSASWDGESPGRMRTVAAAAALGSESASEFCATSGIFFRQLLAGRDFARASHARSAFDREAFRFAKQMIAEGLIAEPPISLSRDISPLNPRLVPSLVLFGLGIDYGVHFYARYAEERAEGRSAADAIEETFMSTGQAITVGALLAAAVAAAAEEGRERRDLSPCS